MLRFLHAGPTLLRCYRRTGLLPLLLPQQQHQLHGFCCTPMARFDIKQYEMEKRRRRELERAGIDADADDEPWVAPEEQRRIDEEEQQRRAEEAERVKEMLARRAQEDIEKRKKFKEFRARQLAMSRNRKEANSAVKQHARGSQRVLDEVIDDTEASTHEVAAENLNDTKSA